MTTREITSEYRMAEWRRIIEDRAASGKNVREYCREHGLRTNTYYYRLNKLRVAAGEALIIRAEQPEAKSHPGWMQVKQIPDAVNKCSDNDSQGMTVEIGKFRVTIGAHDSAEQMTKVFSALNTIC